MLKTSLTLVRHGQTVWNLAHKYQGQGDSPLTETGQHQARAVGEFLSDQSFHAFYSSDLGRAAHTAALMQDAICLKPILDAIWRERAYGKLEGLVAEQVDSIFGAGTRHTLNSQPDCDLHGAESLAALRQRVGQALQKVLQNHAGQHVLVVTHGAVLHSAFKLITGIPLDQPRRFSLRNASVNQLHHDGEHWSIDKWGFSA